MIGAAVAAPVLRRAPACTVQHAMLLRGRPVAPIVPPVTIGSSAWRRAVAGGVALVCMRQRPRGQLVLDRVAVDGTAAARKKVRQALVASCIALACIAALSKPCSVVQSGAAAAAAPHASSLYVCLGTALGALLASLHTCFRERMTSVLFPLSAIPFGVFLAFSPYPRLANVGLVLYIVFWLGAAVAGKAVEKKFHGKMTQIDWIHGLVTSVSNIPLQVVLVGLSRELRKYSARLQVWSSPYGMASMAMLAGMAALMSTARVRSLMETRRELARSAGDGRDSLSAMTWCAHFWNFNSWTALMILTRHLGMASGQAIFTSMSWALTLGLVVSGVVTVLHAFEDDAQLSRKMDAFFPIFNFALWLGLCLVVLASPRTAAISSAVVAQAWFAKDDLFLLAFLFLQAYLAAVVVKRGRRYFGACFSSPPAWPAIAMLSTATLGGIVGVFF